MMWGLYVPGKSWLHHQSAGLKLGMVAIAGLLIVYLHHPLILGGFLLTTILFIFVLGLPWRIVVQQLSGLVWILVGIFLLQALLNDWQVGLVLVLRFLNLMLLATMVTLTTTISDMTTALEQALQPLQRLGLRPAQLSLMIAIAIRLIPLMLDQLQAVREAQRSRGIDRPVITLLIPVIIRVLQLADHLTDALDARGYDADDVEAEVPDQN